TFEDAIDRATDNGVRRVSLMKIDCEGAEFPILLTSNRLGCIDRIVGEYHELRAELPRHVRLAGCEQFAVESLVARLEAFGFAVELEPQAVAKFGGLGLFFADRGARRLRCSWRAAPSTRCGPFAHALTVRPRRRRRR